MDATKDQVKADFDVLKKHLFDLQIDYFGSQKPLVYGTGKEMFHELDSLLKKDGISLQDRMNAVVMLAPGHRFVPAGC